MKKFFELCLIVLLTSLSPVVLKAQDISLNGKWALTYFPQPEDPVSNPKDLPDIKGSQQIGATVPGNVELDLLKAGLIKSPMIGSNVYSLRKYEGYQWCYTKKFLSPSFATNQQAWLSFGGIDCVAEIWLNGKHLGSVQNMFIEHKYNVTDCLVKNAENILQIIIRSAVIEAQKYMLGTISFGYYPAPESVFIRKAPSSYGWNIMPRLVSAGLWRNVSLKVINDTHIVNAQWMTSSINLKSGGAQLLVDVQTKIPFEELDHTRAIISLSREGKLDYEDTVLMTNSVFQQGITLRDVDFWWPRGYGEPALYNATVKLVSESGRMLSEDTCKVGIRTVQLDRSDINEPDSSGNFRFIVNGVPIFVRGTNWVPLDAFHSLDDSLLAGVMQMVTDLNCNMIRCWGGNVYPDNRFYDLCDENGVMVWQDFAMACTIYPQREDFVHLIEKEAESIVIKLRNHPSLVLWSGNNEGDISLSWTLKNFNINPNKDIITRQVLPQVLYEFDPTRPYLPSSPYYSQEVYEQGGQESLLPEDHLWGPRLYYKGANYTQSKASFVSEIGYMGIPNKSSLEKMFTKDAVYPWVNGHVGLWNDEWITKSERRFREKSELGIQRINRFTKQVKIMFGSVPKDLSSFIIASQITQAEALKFFIEKWRGGEPEKSGIIWWNIRDGWPIISDAVADYYNSKKLSYYFIKNVQRNICVFINDSPNGKHPLVVVDNTRQPSNGSAEVTDVVTGKLVYKGHFKVGANGKTQIATLPSMQGQGMLLIRYKIDGVDYANHYLYGDPPFKLDEYLKWLKKTDIYGINEKTNIYTIK